MKVHYRKPLPRRAFLGLAEQLFERFLILLTLFFTPGEQRRPPPAASTPSKETNFNHVPGGCNVLYMDGHAEFVKYTPVAGLATMAAQQAEQALQGSTEPRLATVASAIGVIGDV